MAHTEYYRAKQEMMKKFKEELRTQMEQIKANIREKQLQELFEIAKKKEEQKMLLRIESEEKHREKMRQKYVQLKGDKERYQRYLEHQTAYREKKRQERREEALEKLKEAFGDGLAKYEIGDKFLYCTKSGRIFSEYGIELYGHLHPSGYVAVSFNGKNMMAHRIIWEAFNGKIPQGMEIDHINGDRGDNRLEENLRLCTHKENCNNPRSVENYKKHNKSVDRSYLEDYWKSKRSNKVYQYTTDGKLVKEWTSAAEAAIAGGHTKQAIYNCCKGKFKSHHGFIWSFVKKTDE